MTSDHFQELIKLLTGTRVKQVDSSEEMFLQRALSDDDKRIDCSQFNELLLIVNKDRVEPTFFEYFFSTPSNPGTGCAINEIKKGVDHFRRIAMLRYGNFIYAYRTLSKIDTKDELLKELGRCSEKPDDLIKQYKDRSGKVLEIDEIARDRTFLVGYLSAGEITAEASRAGRLLELLGAEEGDWIRLDGLIKNQVGLQEHRQSVGHHVDS